MRPASPLLALAAALFLGACGGDSSPVPRLARLERAPGRLHPVATAPATDLLRIDFDALPDDWSLITDQKNPLATQPTWLTREIATEGGRTFLSLSGRAGAIYRIVPVEPDTAYLFTGELRARDVVPEQEPFFGATFWLGELAANGSPRDLFGQGADVGLRHPLATAAGAATNGEWQKRRTAFRTSPRTKGLIVGCVFAVNEELQSGTVDFDWLGLARIEDRELWEFEAAAAVAVAHRGDTLPGPDAPDGWRARRSVGAMLGGEQRPAILCFPGERLELDVAVPREDPVLELALAPWPEAFRPNRGDGERVLAFRVRAGGRDRLHEEVALGSTLAATAWKGVRVPLGDLAGERVTLELSVDGPIPGLFGGAVATARGAALDRPNVVLISIDTLRADRVGAYGSDRGVTPEIDAFARESLVFTDVTANAPYTLPAHATLFSGQFPEVHGVEDRGHVLAPRRSPVLARILADHGWRTQAFVAGGFLAPDFGLHSGFDGWSVIDPLRHLDSRYFDDVRRELPDQSVPELFAEPGIARVERWIGEHAAEPFFLFLHTYEVHDYDPPRGTTTCAQQGCTSTLEDFRELMFPRVRDPFPGTPEDREHLQHLYDAALAHVDRQVGQVLDELERLGLAERTIVVVTTDHGEEFFERGHLQHGKTLYDEMLRIPLIVHVPGRAPARRTTPAMQVDVAPTLLGLLGLPPDPRMQGRDLLAAEVPPLPVFSDVDDLFARKSALRDGAWKLVHGPLDADVSVKNTAEWQLFDLARDAGETNDLSAAEPQRLAELQRRLLGFAEHLTTLREQLGPLEDAEVQDATQQLLKQLGY